MVTILYSVSFYSLVYFLVSALDNHVSVKQLMSVRNLKGDSTLIVYVLKCTELLKKAHAAFDQGWGFEGLRVRGVVGWDFVIFSDGFFNIHVIDIFTKY